MKVGIFTPRSLKPLHPRLVAYQTFFEAEKIEFGIHSFSSQTSQEFSITNWLSLWFFDWNAVKRCKPLVNQYDIILVNDMKYLPLVQFAHRSGKKVIYETIDHNVYLRFHQLQTRFSIFKYLKKIIPWLFEKIEKKYVDRYCHEVIVNSDALKDYFGNKANVLFYSSPLENSDSYNNSENQLALLYLGAFTKEKGALQTIALAQKMKLPLHIYGPVSELEVTKIIQTEDVMHTTKLATPELKLKLKELLNQYFLIGISLIEPVHYSYEVQEANKDIDYLSLGIPIIGNHRKPTADKINKGCGWFIDDPDLARKITSKQELKQQSDQCKIHYAANYASVHFYEKLKACWFRAINH